MPAPPWELDAQPPDLALLVVLAEEFEGLAARYGTVWFARPNPTYGGFDYFWIDQASGYRCVASFSGRMSPEEAVQLANRLLAYEPATIVNVGIAAGLHGDVKIGDVVVPDLVVAYDKTTKVRPRLDAAGREIAEAWTFERRADAFRATHALVEATKHLAFAHRDALERWRERGRVEFGALSTRSAKTQAAVTELLSRRNPVLCAEPDLHITTLASGHAVVASEAFAKWVREGNGDIKALEMEAAGMLLAAERRVEGVAKLVIRGISDHSAVDKAKTEAIEAGALRRLAMHNALGVLELLMALDQLPRAATRHEDASTSVELEALSAELERRSQAGEDVTELREAVFGTRRLLRSGLALRVGDELADRYRLDALAGTGGFASVWKAWDKTAKTMVAVKVLHRQWVADASRVERFRSGARQMAKLEHPGVVPVLAIHADHDPPFFVMPYMVHGDLFRAIKDERISTFDALRALARVAEAIEHAHARSVIHRDIKPHNILVDAAGAAYLADFDLVYAIDTTHGTRTGALGTYIYAAPEQLEDASRPDARVDVYGLGMTALYCLLRRNPTPMVADRRPQELQQLRCSDALARAIRRAVACEPSARASDCAELADVLHEPEAPEKRGVEKRWIVGLVTGVVVVTGGFGLAQTLGGADQPQKSEVPEVVPTTATEPEPETQPTAAPEPKTNPTPTPAPTSMPTPTPQCEPGDACTGGLCDAQRTCVDLTAHGLVSIPSGKLKGTEIGGFWLDKTEVTVASYERCVAAKRCEPRSSIVSERKSFDDDNAECNWNRSRADHPMNCVNASDASNYCKWRASELPAPAGWAWSLPTETQWEWAAMGGVATTLIYPFEGEPTAERVNACGPECVAYRKEKVDQGLETEGKTIAPMYPTDDGWRTTAPVGSKPEGSTVQGVADLAGNVWEWTKTPKEGTFVIRGGGWRTEKREQLSLEGGRGEVLATQQTSFVGFRCALVPEAQR